jgi:hypothetical protein
MPQTRRLSALKSIAAIAFSTLVVMAVTVVPAHADERRDGHHDDRDRDRHRDDHYRRGYPPPPVVYAPYYAPPPVVYGPSVGVYLPGISIGIH